MILSFASDDNPKATQEYLEYELMIEWGLTPNEYYAIDEEHIRRILEYREARARGEAAKAEKEKAKYSK